MITLDVPESREDATTMDLVSFTANLELKYAEASFNVGFLVDGMLHKTRTLTIIYQDDSGLLDIISENGHKTQVVKSFKGLVQRSPAAKNLKADLLQDAIDVDAVAGVVD